MEDLGYQPHLAVPNDKRRRHNHKKPKLNNWILVQLSRTMNSLCSKNSHLFQVAMLSVHKPHLILVQPAIRFKYRQISRGRHRSAHYSTSLRGDRLVGNAKKEDIFKCDWIKSQYYKTHS